MSNESKESNNVQRIVRLKDDYLKLCSFLEFKAQSLSMERAAFYDELFRFSLDYLRENGFTYFIRQYGKVRTAKGISLSVLVSDDLDASYNFFYVFYRKKYKRKLHFGEFVELILYIYAMNKLTDSERNLFDIDYGIEKAAD